MVQIYTKQEITMKSPIQKQVMKSFIKSRLRALHFWQKEFLTQILSKLPCIKGNIIEHLLTKYFWHFFIILSLLLLTLISHFFPLSFKKQTQVKINSLDHLVPKGFVLVPIEINNGKDILNIIGEFGVVDLYTYSDQADFPGKQAASSMKILPPDHEEGRFLALVPEKEVTLLFEYSNPFYAVIQNPKQKNSKIYKKKEKKSFIVIEEHF